MNQPRESGPGEVRIRLFINGRWTAGDFSRVFDLLSEANALVSAISLDRLSVRHKGEEALYLRRALRPDDPKVMIEAVQFGSPGSILARLPGAVRLVWDLLKDLLWKHKTEKSQAETGLALKQEELLQARLRTEALRLDLERLREELKQSRLDTAGSRLDLFRREEELARAVVEGRLGTAAAVLEAIAGFHRRTGVPYTLIEKYLLPVSMPCRRTWATSSAPACWREWRRQPRPRRPLLRNLARRGGGLGYRSPRDLYLWEGGFWPRGGISS